MTKKELSIRERAENAWIQISKTWVDGVQPVDVIEALAQELIAETKGKCIKICEVDWPEGIVKDKKKYEAADAIAQAIRELK